MREIVKKIPVIEKFIHSTYYRCFRHRISLVTDPRENSTFTGFHRLPTQFEALANPVIDFFSSGSPPEHIKIAVIGCSNGSEAYTIGSILVDQNPDLDFDIRGYDIDAEMIDKASSACYTHDEIYFNKRIPAEFIARTFNIENDLYTVKNTIADKASFFLADALSPDLAEQVGLADIVFAQNFLFHLTPKHAAKAFDNICRVLKPRSVIFVDGVDIGLRIRHSLKNGLAPLEYKIEEIHNEARWARSAGWPYRYWGLEPFMTLSNDWQRRYATIFFKG